MLYDVTNNIIKFFVNAVKILLKLTLLLWLILICWLMIARGCSHNKNEVTYNFDTYLTENSSFEKNIATVLPSKEDLANTKILYYIYCQNETLTFENKMLHLTVEYSDENFAKALQTMQTNWETHYYESAGKPFYYNGIRYDGFAFYNHGDFCGIAYHVCTDSNTISYIAFVNDELGFMSVAAALNSCLGSFPAFQNQIIEDM